TTANRLLESLPSRTWVKPGEEVDLKVEVTNNTDKSANKAILTLIDPDRNIIATQTITAFIPPHSTAKITYHPLISIHSTLGIWWIDYELQDIADNTIQPQTEGSQFAISEHLTNTQLLSDLIFSVTTPDGMLVAGSDVTFSIQITNKGSETRNITICWDWTHDFPTADDSPNPLGIFSISAGKTIEVPCTKRNVYGKHGNVWQLWIRFYEDNWRELANRSVGGEVISPSIEMNIKTDRKIYIRGDNVDIELNLTDKANCDYFTTLRIFNPDNAVIFATTTTLTLDSNGFAATSFETLLSDDSMRGNYIVKAEVYVAGKLSNIAQTSFQIPFSQAGISLDSPPALIPHSTSTISFKINNTGLIRVESGSLSASLKSPDNSVIWISGTSTFGTISIAGSITQSFNLPLGSLSFGVYQLEYTLSYDGKRLSGKQGIACNPLINCRFDKSCKAGKSVTGTLTIINTGHAEMMVKPEIAINDFGYKNVLTESSISADSAIDISLNIPIPATATHGIHHLMVSIGEVDPIINEFDFVISSARLEFNLPKRTYQQGEAGTITIKNIGGVDAAFDYTLTIVSPTGILVCDRRNNLMLGVDSIIEQGFQLPHQTLEGTYSLDINCGYLDINWPVELGRFNRTINISGIKPVLNISTTRQKYTSNEHVFGSVTITPQIQDGTLRLKVFKENEAWTVYTGIGNDMKAIGMDMDYVWYGGSEGVSRYQKSTGSWTTLTPSDGLEGWQVNSIGVDEDAVWFGHGYNEGISKYDKQTGNFKRFTNENTKVLPTWKENVVIAVDDRYIWFNGNCRYDKSNNIWGTWTPPAGELVLEKDYAWYKGVPVCKYNTETQTSGFYFKRSFF
ncbi:MAG: hypothetical protein QME49_08690, partial [bacterium]|nr:hypothetical protein [bacterium]